MSFIKVECVSGCGWLHRRVCLLVTLLTKELTCSLTSLFSLLRAEFLLKQKCRPLTLCAFVIYVFVLFVCCYFSLVQLLAWCLVSCYSTFFSRCQSQTPTRKNHLFREEIIQKVFYTSCIHLTGLLHFLFFAFDSLYCQTPLTVLYNTLFFNQISYFSAYTDAHNLLK